MRSNPRTLDHETVSLAVIKSLSPSTFLNWRVRCRRVSLFYGCSLFIQFLIVSTIFRFWSSSSWFLIGLWSVITDRLLHSYCTHKSFIYFNLCFRIRMTRIWWIKFFPKTDFTRHFIKHNVMKSINDEIYGEIIEFLVAFKSLGLYLYVPNWW